MTKVINILGGPGLGKSTTAMGVTLLLKLRGYRVEYVPEVAKDLVWANSNNIKDQRYISNLTYEKLKAINGKVDYIVTDSGLISGIYYNKYCCDNDSKIEDFILTKYKEFNNLNIMLLRSPEIAFDSVGRIHNEDESFKIDLLLGHMLSEREIPYISVKSCKLSHNLKKSHFYKIIKNYVLT